MFNLFVSGEATPKIYREDGSVDDRFTAVNNGEACWRLGFNPHGGIVWRFQPEFTWRKVKRSFDKGVLPHTVRIQGDTVVRSLTRVHAPLEDSHDEPTTFRSYSDWRFDAWPLRPEGIMPTSLIQVRCYLRMASKRTIAEAFFQEGPVEVVKCSECGDDQVLPTSDTGQRWQNRSKRRQLDSSAQ